MKNHFLLLIFLFAVACVNKKQQPVQQDQKTQPAAFSDTVNTDDYKELFVERGAYEDSLFKLVALSRLNVPEKLSEDSSYYFSGNFLSLTNKGTNKSYKIRLTEPCSYGTEIAITNVTTSLKFNKPLFEVISADCNDLSISEFIQLEKDSLRYLFEIGDYGPAELTRLNENTLTGTAKNRDEIVGYMYDCPFTVSLTDYSVKDLIPVKQKLGVESEALENIKGYRLNDPNKKQFTIKEGTKLFIDSLYRDTKQILLIMKDSSRVICTFSEVEGKLQGNAAG